MSTLLKVVLLSLLFVTRAFAQEDSESPPASAPVEAKSKTKSSGKSKAKSKAKSKSQKPLNESSTDSSVEDPESTSAADLSKNNRKSMSLGGVVGASAVGSHAGIDYWKSISKKSTYVGTIITSGKGEIKAESDTAPLLEYISASFYGIDIAGRHFFGNSFYAQGLFAYSSYRGDYGVKGNEKVGFSGEYTLPYKATVMSLGAAIGNQWSWRSGFTIGCSWFGYNQPISSSISVAEPTGGSSNSELLAALLDTDVEAQLTKNIRAMSSVYLLRLQVGYNF
jgi:hypothetical protein